MPPVMCGIFSLHSKPIAAAVAASNKIAHNSVMFSSDLLQWEFFVMFFFIHWPLQLLVQIYHNDDDVDEINIVFSDYLLRLTFFY